jgi:hypothetical protein
VHPCTEGPLAYGGPPMQLRGFKYSASPPAAAAAAVIVRSTCR